jgi:hypothetical protein
MVGPRLKPCENNPSEAKYSHVAIKRLRDVRDAISSVGYTYFGYIR